MMCCYASWRVKVIEGDRRGEERRGEKSRETKSREERLEKADKKRRGQLPVDVWAVRAHVRSSGPQ